MDFNKTWGEFHKLLHVELDHENEFPRVRPLIAHYTSLVNLEKILSNEEVWLSNPLFMNDLEEVRFGVNNGVNLVNNSDKIRIALVSDTRISSFYKEFDIAFGRYAEDLVFDLYVMCFSRHDPKNTDGMLSMWRGYGSNGQGAALVIDTSKVTVEGKSPLAFAPVSYATPDERREFLSSKIEAVAKFISENDIPDEYVHSLAAALFKRICLFAVFSKHSGFQEEDEWRLVYFKDRDENKRLEPYFDYTNSADGIQPKLKLPTGSLSGVIKEDFELSSIIHSIIVGPTSSSALTQLSIDRMLEKVQMPELKNRIRLSGIPYRG